MVEVSLVTRDNKVINVSKFYENEHTLDDHIDFQHDLKQNRYNFRKTYIHQIIIIIR